MFTYDPTCHTPLSVTVARTAAPFRELHHLPADQAGVGRLVHPVGDVADLAEERRRAPVRLMRIGPSVAEELAELLSDGHRLAHPLHPAIERGLRVRRVPPAFPADGDHPGLVS